MPRANKNKSHRGVKDRNPQSPGLHARMETEGVPVKVASEMLGHSDVTTTLRIYAHVIEGAQEQAASAMDRLFHS